VSTSRRRSGHLGQLAGGSVVGWVVGGVVDPAAPEHPDPGVGQDPDRGRVVGAAGDGGTRGGVRGKKSRTSWPDRVCDLGVAWQAVRRQRGADVVWRCMTSTPSSPCLGIRLSDDKAARLDAKALALARLAALVAVGASCVCYGWAVGSPGRRRDGRRDRRHPDRRGADHRAGPGGGGGDTSGRPLGRRRPRRAFRHCIASCAIDREGSGNQERPSQAYLASRPISCTRWTAWPRELAPSLR
jgi:hypothetical protein